MSAIHFFLLERNIIMKKTNRWVSCLLAVALLFTAFTLTINARVYSIQYNSPSVVAGTEYSCKNSQMVNLTSQFSNPDSGNAGVYFYVTSVGLDYETYYWDTTRKMYVYLYEYDALNADDYVCKYTGSFSIRSDTGLYQPYYWGRTDMDDVEVIETNSGLELYLTLYVETRDADTTHNVPQGLIRYCIWAD